MTPRLTNAILENSIVVLLSIFISLMPYGLHQSSYVLALACVLSVVYRLIKGKTSMFGSFLRQEMFGLYIPMLMILVLHIIGMLYSPLPPKESWKATEQVLSFLAFPVMFLLLGQDFFTLKRLKFFAIVLCALCFWIVVVYITGFCRAVAAYPELKTLYQQHHFFDLLNAFLANADYFVGYSRFFILHHTIQAWYMLTAMGVVVYTWVAYPQWYKAWYVKTAVALLLLLYAGVGVVLAASKMGWLMFGLWILLVLYFLWRRKCYGLAIGGLVLILGMTVFLFARMSTLSYLADRTYHIFKERVIEQKSQEEVAYDGSVSPRLMLWKKAVDGVKAKPWFGWGTGGEKAVIEEYGGNPHNQWLLYGLRFGVIGFLALAWLWWAGFRLAYQKKNYLLFLFLFLSFCFMFTDRMLEYQPGVTFFCMYYGLLVLYTLVLPAKQTAGCGSTADENDPESAVSKS